MKKIDEALFYQIMCLCIALLLMYQSYTWRESVELTAKKIALDGCIGLIYRSNAWYNFTISLLTPNVTENYLNFSVKNISINITK